MEGKKGWTERQRMMHSDIGKRIAQKAGAESRSKEAGGWRGGNVFTSGPKKVPQATQSVVKEF